MFLDKQFPPKISLGASGGPMRKVHISTLASGQEQRLSHQKYSKRQYELGTAISRVEDLQEVIAFFEICGGALLGFRFKDAFDHSTHQPPNPVSAYDVVLGVGDGKMREFPLFKPYKIGQNTYERPITRPIKESVKIAVDQRELPLGEGVLLKDYGVLHFEHAPETGAKISCGFEFDVPVRFNIDEIIVNMSDFESGLIPNIPLVEIFEHQYREGFL